MVKLHPDGWILTTQKIGGNEYSVEKPTKEEPDGWVVGEGVNDAVQNVINGGDVNADTLDAAILALQGTTVTATADDINNAGRFATGSYLFQSADTAQNITNTAVYGQKYKDIEVYRGGVVNAEFTLYSGSFTAYGKIYVNDVAVGTERSVTGGATTTFNEDITISVGDNVQVYCYRSAGGGTTPTISNFRLKVAQFDGSTVVLD